jgi:hypothetical protein
MQDHDEVYDKLLEENEKDRQKKQSKEKEVEGLEKLKPTFPPRKAKSVVKIAALEAGGDISQEKVMAKLKSNPLVKDLSEKPEKMSNLPKDPQKDFVPKNAKDLPKSMRLASGGKVKSASARADGCAIRGKTRA